MIKDEVIADGGQSDRLTLSTGAPPRPTRRAATRARNRPEKGQRPRSARMRRAALCPAAPMTEPAGWQPALPA
ncbi:hypothetical protein GCM10009682_55120 [Luedemannella flava]|uniref:Uncharacterized protein n=1 Tax=Luedemannella flava TaxID=349316 RepID=A0ABP4YS73_9ACTN